MTVQQRLFSREEVAVLLDVGEVLDLADLGLVLRVGDRLGLFGSSLFRVGKSVNP